MTNPAAATADLDRMLHKVQSLIAKADSTDSEHEAEACRNRAEAIMFKYRIEESMLAGYGASKGNLVPVWRTIRIHPLGSQFSQTYRYLIGGCLAHVDCKGRVLAGQVTDEEGNRWMEVDAVGYESDLRYAEMLFTSFALAFAGKMEPRRNPTLSDQENAYLMRSAGMEGKRIAMALWGNIDKSNRVKARRLFAAEAALRGEDASVLLGQGNSVKVYRDSYADAFENEMYDRLRRMHLSNGTDGAVVLKSRKDAVLEAWYAKFPEYRPNPHAFASNQIGGRDTCEKCRKAKSGYCREHAHLRPSMAARAPRRYSAAGAERGRVAAQSVDIGSAAGSRVDGHTGPTTAIGGA